MTMNEFPEHHPVTHGGTNTRTGAGRNRGRWVCVSPAPCSKMCSLGADDACESAYVLNALTTDDTVSPLPQLSRPQTTSTWRWRWCEDVDPTRTSRGVLSRRPARSGLTNSHTALCSPSSLRASTCAPNSTLVQLVKRVAPSVGVCKARPHRTLPVGLRAHPAAEGLGGFVRLPVRRGRSESRRVRMRSGRRRP